MLIVCPSCATSYDVELARLEPNGRQVRCLRCSAVWRAEPSRADKLMAAAVEIAPEREMAEATAGVVAAEPAPPLLDELPAAGEVTAPDDVSAVEPAPAEAVAAAGETDSAVDVEAPPIAPADLDAGQPAEAEAAHPTEPTEQAEPLEDVETYAARREKLSRKRLSLRWPLSNLQSGILALLVIDAIVIGWRNDFVRVFPQTASFYAMLGLPVNVRGVAFDSVATTTEQHDGVPVLVVEGNVVNDTRKIVDVPRLKFVLRNDTGAEIYSWTAVPPRANLSPGETIPFRSRLASPPPDGRDVLVRFVTRHDIISGNR